MKPIGDTGQELNANFSVEPTSDGAALFLKSRGGSTGGQPPRNPDYARALELLLHRLGQNSAVLTGIEVYSRETLVLPVEERRITAPDFPLPLALASLSDAERERFRNQVGSASAALGRAPEKTSGGNPTKQLRLALDWPAAVGRDAEELEALLARVPVAAAKEPHPRLEEPTSDPDELEKRVRREKLALKRLRGSLRPPARAKRASKSLRISPAPPPVSGPPKLEYVTTTRYARRAEVIAWVLVEAGDICEVCYLPAPFKDKYGDPFLEVHHVRPLAEGGPDECDNAVAACPNCHRRMHLSADREAVRTTTIAKVERLIDHPARAPLSKEVEDDVLAASPT